MQDRKHSTKSSKTHSASKLRSVSTKKGQPARQGKMQAVLKRTTSNRKELQKKITQLNAQWKERIKQIEANALKKARELFEKEFSKKEEARQKAIASALAKFEKQYTTSHRSGLSTGRNLNRRSKSSHSSKRTRVSA